jgi:DNA invertase Pin-like site-specific DNA recombinase
LNDGLYDRFFSSFVRKTCCHKNGRFCDKKKAAVKLLLLEIPLKDRIPRKMLIGYMRISKADGSQIFDLQRDALLKAGVKQRHFYEDRASGKRDTRPGLEACLKALRKGDTLIVWKLDRLGRSLPHLVNTVHGLMERKIDFRVLTGQGANIDTRTASGRLVFGIFASLAEFERELIRERTMAGLMSARARGRNGGRPYKMTVPKMRMAQAAMAKRGTRVGDLCRELGITRQTLYRFVDPKGAIRADGVKLLKCNAKKRRPLKSLRPSNWRKRKLGRRQRGRA